MTCTHDQTTRATFDLAGTLITQVRCTLCSLVGTLQQDGSVSWSGMAPATPSAGKAPPCPRCDRAHAEGPAVRLCPCGLILIHQEPLTWARCATREATPLDLYALSDQYPRIGFRLLVDAYLQSLRLWERIADLPAFVAAFWRLIDLLNTHKVVERADPEARQELAAQFRVAFDTVNRLMSAEARQELAAQFDTVNRAEGT